MPYQLCTSATARGVVIRQRPNEIVFKLNLSHSESSGYHCGLLDEVQLPLNLADHPQPYFSVVPSQIQTPNQPPDLGVGAFSMHVA